MGKRHGKQTVFQAMKKTTHDSSCTSDILNQDFDNGFYKSLAKKITDKPDQAFYDRNGRVLKAFAPKQSLF